MMMHRGSRVAAWLVFAAVWVGTSGLARAAWDCYGPQPGHPTAAEKDAYINELKVYAQEAESTYGTPAAALLAMASNEGGFGWTRTGQYANNLFGWKYYGSVSAGGRSPYTLSCQPSWDPNNQYVTFNDRRDSVLFVAMKLATLAVSLGGVETLVEHPASMTHAGMSAEDRREAGFTDGLVRYSVGLEDVEDLIADLRQALDIVAATTPAHTRSAATGS
jgi:hypothetical protein